MISYLRTVLTVIKVDANYQTINVIPFNYKHTHFVDIYEPLSNKIPLHSPDLTVLNTPAFTRFNCFSVSARCVTETILAHYMIRFDPPLVAPPPLQISLTVHLSPRASYAVFFWSRHYHLIPLQCHRVWSIVSL